MNSKAKERFEQPPAERQVEYRFVIDTNLVTRPGFPPAIGKSRSEGKVIAIDGSSLPPVTIN